MVADTFIMPDIIALIPAVQLNTALMLTMALRLAEIALDALIELLRAGVAEKIEVLTIIVARFPNADIAATQVAMLSSVPSRSPRPTREEFTVA